MIWGPDSRTTKDSGPRILAHMGPGSSHSQEPAHAKIWAPDPRQPAHAKIWGPDPWQPTHAKIWGPDSRTGGARITSLTGGCVRKESGARIHGSLPTQIFGARILARKDSGRDMIRGPDPREPAHARFRGPDSGPGFSHRGPDSRTGGPGSHAKIRGPDPSRTGGPGSHAKIWAPDLQEPAHGKIRGPDPRQPAHAKIRGPDPRKQRSGPEQDSGPGFSHKWGPDHTQRFGARIHGRLPIQRFGARILAQVGPGSPH
ncbi:hypothetical protein DFH27DRAFT_608533 [Peziza echinospora]|nr:hypothetical protein DFH27DRAFT_608533 [Peziza echinospora]